MLAGYETVDREARSPYMVSPFPHADKRPLCLAFGVLPNTSAAMDFESGKILISHFKFVLMATNLGKRKEREEVSHG
jgi:hypothetical protein